MFATRAVFSKVGGLSKGASLAANRASKSSAFFRNKEAMREKIAKIPVNPEYTVVNKEVKLSSAIDDSKSVCVPGEFGHK